MKDDILEGLKNALSKGEQLQYAMQSFHNAGYEMKDIEEAAHELQLKMPQYFPKPNPVGVQVDQEIPNKETFSPNPPIQKVSNYEQNYPNPNPPEVQEKQEIPNKETFSPNPPIQRVSNYEQKQTNPKKIIVIVIVSLIVILVLFLGGIFLFRERLLEFFNTLFS